MINQPAINDKTCYSCGMIFRTPAEYDRHKARKTPCIIREIPQGQLTNPNRCIYCNRVMSKRNNLLRHLAVCKVKNGGMEVLAAKVMYEHENKLLRDQQVVMVNQIKVLTDRVDKLEQAPKAATLDVHDNTTNTTNNTTNNFHFYNFDKPKTDTLVITQDDMMVENITKKVIELIYFNKLIPENHTLYLPNIKDDRLLVHKDNGWQMFGGVDLSPVFVTVKNNAYNIGEPIDDAAIMRLAAQHRELIRKTYLSMTGG
jgi:uncharacterized C2H2 Zn-finger protein